MVGSRLQESINESNMKRKAALAVSLNCRWRWAMTLAVAGDRNLHVYRLVCCALCSVVAFTYAAPILAFVISAAHFPTSSILRYVLFMDCLVAILAVSAMRLRSRVATSPRVGASSIRIQAERRETSRAWTSEKRWPGLRRIGQSDASGSAVFRSSIPDHPTSQRNRSAQSRQLGQRRARSAIGVRPAEAASQCNGDTQRCTRSG